MVILLEVGIDDFQAAMPPFCIEKKGIKHVFPPVLTHPIESSIPFKTTDYEKVVDGILEKRSNWLGKWNSRYCVIMKYRIQYRLTNTTNVERTKFFFYLYYWRDVNLTNGNRCADDIINLNSCEELMTTNIRLPNDQPLIDSPYAVLLKARKYGVQTRVHELKLSDIPSYYIRFPTEEEYLRWSILLKSVVSCHINGLYRKQYGAGDFRTIESRKITTTIIDGFAALSFPEIFGYVPYEKELVIESQGGVVGNYPKKLRGKDEP